MAVVTLSAETPNTAEATQQYTGLAGAVAQTGDATDKAKEKTSAWHEVLKGMAQGAGQMVFQQLAAAAGQFTSSMSHALEIGGKISDIVAQTGQLAESVQTFSYAGEQAGVAGELITASLSKMQRGLVDTPEKFRAVGLSVNDLIRSRPDQAFEQIAAKVAAVENPTQRAAMAIELFGKSGAAMLPMILSLQEAQERAEKLGFVLSGEAVAALDRLGDTLNDVQKATRGAFDQVGAAVAGSEVLQTIVDDLALAIGELANWVKDNHAAITDWVDQGIIYAVGGLHLLLDVVDAGYDVFQSLQGVLQAARDAVVDLYTSLTGVSESALTAQNVWTALRVTWLSTLNVAATLGEALLTMKKALLFDGDPIKAEYEEQIAVLARYKASLSDEANAIIAGTEAKDTHARITDGLRQSIDAYQARLESVARTQREHADATRSGGAAVERFGKDSELAAKAAKAAWEAYNKQVHDLLQEHQKLSSLLGPSMRDLVDEQLNVTAAMENLGGVTKASDEELRTYIDRLEAIYRTGKDVPGIVDDLSEALMELARRAPDALPSNAKGIVDELRRRLDEMKAAARERLAAITDLVLDIVGALAQLPEAFARATDSANALQRVLGGAAVGGQLGSKLGSLAEAFGVPGGEAAGRFIGSFIGGVAGLFHSPAWISVGREAGGVLGMAVSEELAREIEKKARELGGDVKAAALLSLDKAMSEHGGPASAFSPQVVHLQEMAAAGKHTAEALAQVDTAFGRIRDEAMEAGAVGSRALDAILSKARETGQLTAGMRDWLAQQTDKYLEGFQDVVAGLESDRLGRAQGEMFADAWAMAIAEGGIRSAIEELKDEFHELAAAGVEIPAEIARMFELVESSPAFAGALQVGEGLRKQVEALASAALLTSDTFARLGQTAQAAYEQAIAGGAGEREALMTIMPYLSAAVAASREHGLVLDEVTQRYVDQAEAAGFAFPLDPISQLIGKLDELIGRMDRFMRFDGSEVHLGVRTSYYRNDDLADGPAGAPFGAGSGVEPRIGTSTGSGGRPSSLGDGAGASAAGAAARGGSTTSTVINQSFGAIQLPRVTNAREFARQLEEVALGNLHGAATVIQTVAARKK